MWHNESSNSGKPMGQMSSSCYASQCDCWPASNLINKSPLDRADSRVLLYPLSLFQFLPSVNAPVSFLNHFIWDSKKKKNCRFSEIGSGQDQIQFKELTQKNKTFIHSHVVPKP